MESFRLRVRRVRMKSGGSIELLRPAEKDPDREQIERAIENVLDEHAITSDFSGFALVVWGDDLCSTGDCAVGARSVIPVIVVPDFVRNYLLAAKIRQFCEPDDEESMP